MASANDPEQKGYRRAVTEALSSAEVATLLGLKPAHVRHLTRTIDLPYARQIGRDWVYWPEDVETLRHREDGRATRWQQRETS